MIARTVTLCCLLMLSCLLTAAARPGGLDLELEMCWNWWFLIRSQDAGVDRGWRGDGVLVICFLVEMELLLMLWASCDALMRISSGATLQLSIAAAQLLL